MSTTLQPFLDVLMDSCVTTEKLARKCLACGCDLPEKFGRPAKYCKECNPQRHFARDMQSELEREMRVVANNYAFRSLHRDCGFTFDGRYEGPLNQCFTVDNQLRKDHATQKPLEHDVHVRPVVKKSGPATPEDHDWATRQRAFPHTLSMPRAYTSFCVTCVEMVIDVTGRKFRVTRGMYLPIEHECNSVRVYDLRGQLLEVKSL